MNGENVYVELTATYNAWGDNPLYTTDERFGNLYVEYVPFYSEPCAIPGGSGGGIELVLQNSFGEPYDTLYSTEGTPTNLTQLEQDYATADELFLTGDLTTAKTSYKAITESEATNIEKRKAYEQLYKIGKLTGADSVSLADLQTEFQTMAANETDLVLKKIFNQLSSLTKVSREEFIPAIDDFTNIVNLNPGTDEAFYAEVDILTTSLNLQGDSTQLGKMGNGKYLVKSPADFSEKLNNLLFKHFGVEGFDDEKEIIPKDYLLYQNYPNPFNPSTTIRYELPQDGFVELEVFDILGRRVMKLVDEEKAAGRYEVRFDANRFASGIYIYRLQAGDYVNSKKMLLLK